MPGRFTSLFSPPQRDPKPPRPALLMPSNVEASRVAILVLGTASINAVVAAVIVFLLLLPVGTVIDIPWGVRLKIIVVAFALGAGSGLFLSRVILHEAALQEEDK